MKGQRISTVLMALVFLVLTVWPMEASAETLAIESVTVQPEEIHLGDTVTWTVNVTGGTAPYTYEYSMTKRPIFRTIRFGIPESEVTSDSNRYEFLLDLEEVSYRFHVTVTDAAGKKASYASGEYDPKGGVKDKVEQVVAEYAYDGLSDYEKAYNLYDWLCANAEYDDTYTWYSAAGVLLHGTGVCDSFSRAYHLLLDEAGIENEIVHGTADYNGGSHGWVMVKLDGEWYHMDPTWDEAYDFKCYFGLSTELIERDHTSEYLYDIGTLEKDYNIPTTAAVKYNYALNHSDVVFSEISELDALIAAVPANKSTIRMYCTGVVSRLEFNNWFNPNRDKYGIVAGYGSRGSYSPMIYFELTRLVAVTIPSSVKEIEAEAFSKNYAVKNVYAAGDQLESIGSRAFADCTNLKLITLPESVTFIADDAFTGCKKSMIVFCERGGFIDQWFSAHGFTNRVYLD